MSHAEVEAFFGIYREAFDRLDGGAVAELWHTPSGITSARGGAKAADLTWWIDDASMRANHRALCDLYRGSGYHRAVFEIVDCISLGADHAFANVHSTLSRADGSLLQDFRTGYNLLRTVNGLKVLLVTAYEENLVRMERNAVE